jgi:hypothetical protein
MLPEMLATGENDEDIICCTLARHILPPNGEAKVLPVREIQWLRQSSAKVRQSSNYGELWRNFGGTLVLSPPREIQGEILQGCAG